MSEDSPRRLTLLYQLYLTSQASRGFMRLALADVGMGGEEYALFSYLYANGSRSLSQAARDLGVPITTLAGLIAQHIEAGEIERLPHPTDRRARLLSLTAMGRERLELVIPEFTVAYRGLVAQLEEAGVDTEALYEALADLRAGITRTSDLLEAERAAVRNESARRRPGIGSADNGAGR
jgi:DNA-binding MarR family transcriptional regulator